MSFILSYAFLMKIDYYNTIIRPEYNIVTIKPYSLKKYSIVYPNVLNIF